MPTRQLALTSKRTPRVVVGSPRIQPLSLSTTTARDLGGGVEDCAGLKGCTPASLDELLQLSFFKTVRIIVVAHHADGGELD